MATAGPKRQNTRERRIDRRAWTAANFDALADRTVAAEVPARKRFIDDRDGRSGRTVAVVEPTACEQCDAKRAEIAGGDGPPLHGAERIWTTSYRHRCVDASFERQAARSRDRRNGG